MSDLTARLAEAEVSTHEHSHDLVLALRCALGDANAIATLHREHLAELPAILTRSRFADDLAKDAVQRFTERLLMGDPPRIASYEGKGALRSWLRVGATRQALNLRRDSDHKEVALEDDLLAAKGALPELSFVQAAHRGHFEEAFVTAMASLEDRERTLLKLVYVDGLTVERIGRIYAADKSTASRWLTAARDKLHDRTRAHLKQQLRIADATCDDLVDVLRSHLELSVRGLFGA